MARFTTRVELHKADEEDYETLHSSMEREGFSRSILSNDGTAYHLPTAEYNIEDDYSRDQILAKAKKAANSTGCSYEVLVTESKGRTWYNLKSR